MQFDVCRNRSGFFQNLGVIEPELLRNPHICTTILYAVFLLQKNRSSGGKSSPFCTMYFYCTIQFGRERRPLSLISYFTKFIWYFYSALVLRQHRLILTHILFYKIHLVFLFCTRKLLYNCVKHRLILTHIRIFKIILSVFIRYNI